MGTLINFFIYWCSYNFTCGIVCQRIMATVRFLSEILRRYDLKKLFVNEAWISQIDNFTCDIYFCHLCCLTICEYLFWLLPKIYAHLPTLCWLIHILLHWIKAMVCSMINALIRFWITKQFLFLVVSTKLDPWNKHLSTAPFNHLKWKSC